MAIYCDRHVLFLLFLASAYLIVVTYTCTCQKLVDQKVVDLDTKAVVENN